MKLAAAIAGTLPVAAVTLPAAAQEQVANPLAQLPSMGLSLALVLALIVAAAWLLRRSPWGALARASGQLKIVATLPLGPKERLVLVEAGGQRVLLGVGPAGIFPIHQPATEAADAARPAAAPVDFGHLLEERR